MAWLQCSHSAKRVYPGTIWYMLALAPPNTAPKTIHLSYTEAPFLASILPDTISSAFLPAVAWLAQDYSQAAVSQPEEKRLLATV